MVYWDRFHLSTGDQPWSVDAIVRSLDCKICTVASGTRDWSSHPSNAALAIRNRRACSTQIDHRSFFQLSIDLSFDVSLLQLCCSPISIAIQIYLGVLVLQSAHKSMVSLAHRPWKFE